jgi:hypothetical protein
MLHRVALVKTDVSEEGITSNIRIPLTLMIAVIHSSETSILTTSTRRHIPEDVILASDRAERRKSVPCAAPCG